MCGWPEASDIIYIIRPGLMHRVHNHTEYTESLQTLPCLSLVVFLVNIRIASSVALGFQHRMDVGLLLS